MFASNEFCCSPRGAVPSGFKLMQRISKEGASPFGISFTPADVTGNCVRRVIVTVSSNHVLSNTFLSAHDDTNPSD